MRHSEYLTADRYLLAVLVISTILTLPYLFLLGIPSPETAWMYMLAAWIGNFIAVNLFVLVLWIFVRILSHLFPRRNAGA
ncbi:DUF3413 domain-containing protein [Methanorbis furvi]|uniref:Inner membrane protein YejM N-terminal domain-containing protein n=1 Tax=Methanorbis furvi TaxID=3028299 RepID=A0AAE4M9U7_9EURY|nr:hypothetical protein [Methanocorpusculaceae archaeon Ag1]